MGFCYALLAFYLASAIYMFKTVDDVAKSLFFNIKPRNY